VAVINGPTVKIAEGPAAPAVLPALSDAVPEGRLIPIVPFPLIDPIVIVRDDPEPDTTTDPELAVPVVFTATWAADREIVELSRLGSAQVTV
jgi:hypothetical protein